MLVLGNIIFGLGQYLQVRPGDQDQSTVRWSALVSYQHAWSQFYQPICNNAQRCQLKVNDTKDPVLFCQHFCQNLAAYFRLQLLCRAPYFAAFSPNAVGIKIIKNYLRKGCSALAMKMLMKLTHVIINLA